jgi:hypothetical protein
MLSNHRTYATILVSIAIRLAPRAHRDLIRGMAAEFHSIRDRRDRVRFTTGATRAVLHLAVFHPMYLAFHPWTWLAGVGTAAMISLVDTHAGGVCMLVPLVVLAAVVAGHLNAQRAWQWIAAMTIGLVTSSILIHSGFFDRTDFLSVTPLLIIATHLGVFARRVMASTPRGVETG